MSILFIQIQSLFLMATNSLQSLHHHHHPLHLPRPPPPPPLNPKLPASRRGDPPPCHHPRRRTSRQARLHFLFRGLIHPVIRPQNHALRGTQLLNCILQHLAFAEIDQEDEEKQGSNQQIKL